MPMNSVTIRPGVFTEPTQSANEAGIYQSQLIRFKEGLVQTYGGWTIYTPFIVGSPVRDLHAWQGFTTDQHLAFGATQTLSVIHSNDPTHSGTTSDITPQTTT